MRHIYIYILLALCLVSCHEQTPEEVVQGTLKEALEALERNDHDAYLRHVDFGDEMDSLRTAYMKDVGIRVRYLHSDIDTFERAKIIRDMRLDVFDVLVGINLLREGLDIPEIGLVAVLDADKEGFLRSRTSLIQTIGRANSTMHLPLPLIVPVLASPA